MGSDVAAAGVVLADPPQVDVTCPAFSDGHRWVWLRKTWTRAGCHVWERCVCGAERERSEP